MRCFCAQPHLLLERCYSSSEWEHPERRGAPANAQQASEEPEITGMSSESVSGSFVRLEPRFEAGPSSSVALEVKAGMTHRGEFHGAVERDASARAPGSGCSYTMVVRSDSHRSTSVKASCQSGRSYRGLERRLAS